MPLFSSIAHSAGAVARVVGRLLLPPVPRSWRSAVPTLGLYFLGVALIMHVVPSTGPVSRFGVAAALTAILSGASARPRGVVGRVGRWAAIVVTLLTLLCFLQIGYLGIMIFGWAARWWMRLLMVAAGLGTLATAVPARPVVRVPLVLLLGLFAIMYRLSGPDDLSIRCDDYLRAKAQPGVEVLIPTTLAELQCRPGEQLAVTRYPRTLWEAPEGDRFVITSQNDSQVGWFAGRGRKVESRLAGSFCEVFVDPSRPVNCLGEHIADGIVPIDPHGRLVVGQWNRHGRSGSKVWAVTQRTPMRLLAERAYESTTAGGFYDRASGLLGIGFDSGIGIDYLDPVTLAPAAPPVRTRVQGFNARFDSEHGEGILCAAPGPFEPIDGQGYLSIAFHGVPFSRHLLGSTRQYPWARLVAAAGCDWDPDTRVVWLSIFSLGPVIPLHYDTGRVLGGPIAWTVPGVRVVLLDKARQRLYLATWAPSTRASPPTARPSWRPGRRRRPWASCSARSARTSSS